MAKYFEIKQKMWALGGKFTIKDELGLPAYEVTGSFFQIPKTFTIADTQGRLVSKIEKKILTFLPQFTVTLATGQRFTIKKEWTFFKPKYTISGLGMTVQGDFWDMNFTLKQVGQTVAKIRQEWLRMGVREKS